MLGKKTKSALQPDPTSEFSPVSLLYCYSPSPVPTFLMHLIELQFRMSFSSNLNHYGMTHVASVSDVLLDNSFTPPCQRMGGMVSFRTFEDFVR